MMFRSFVLILCLGVLSSVSNAATPVRRCSGDFAFPLSVQIGDCEELPCVVNRGTIVGMDVHFVADRDEIFFLEASVRATVLGIVVPYPLPNDSADVCKNLLYGAYCPLYDGEDVTYHIDFPLESSVPEVTAKCEVKLLDKEKRVVACFLADLKVRRPKAANELQ